MTFSLFNTSRGPILSESLSTLKYEAAKTARTWVGPEIRYTTTMSNTYQRMGTIVQRSLIFIVISLRSYKHNLKTKNMQNIKFFF